MLALLLLLLQVSAGNTVTLAWDAVPGVDGYRVLYGSTSGQYTTTVEEGAVTRASLANLPTGRYYFVVESELAGVASAPSNEVSTLIDPTCIAPLGTHSIQIFPTLLTKTGSQGAGSAARFDFQVGSPSSPVVSIGIESDGVMLPALPGASNPMTGPSIAALAGLWFLVPNTSGMYPLTIVATNAYGCSSALLTSQTIVVAPVVGTPPPGAQFVPGVTILPPSPYVVQQPLVQTVEFSGVAAPGHP